MKKLILTLFLGMFILLTYAQRVNPDGKNWKHTGTHEYTQPLTIEGETLSGAKIDTYDDVVIAVTDTVTLESIAVIESDSGYQKPGSYTTRYDFKNELTNLEFYKMAKLGGATIKPLMPVYPLVNVGSVNLTDGRLILHRFYTSDSTTITGFRIMMATAGNYTGDNYNGICLYRYSADSVYKIAETTNSATFWQSAANNSVDKALSSPISIVPGFYAVGLIYNNSAQTTAPALEGTYSATIGHTIVFTGGWRVASYINSVTTPATTYKYGSHVSGVTITPLILFTY